MDAKETVRVYDGGQTECWLVVHANGRIIYHTENDGYRAGRYGLDPRDEPIDLERVVKLEERHGRNLVAQVVTTLLRLRNRVRHPVLQTP